MRIREAFVVGLLFASGLCGQIATTTSLVGTITDATGQVIPNAKVTATETSTDTVYNATTNDLGYYSIDFVHIGTYRITVTHAGFETVIKTDVAVEINQVVRTDFTLPVGTVNQSVTVEARAPVINTDDATVSEIVATRQVADLPLNGR
ncbi:MAG: carboxypeptidase regulatory-like domain-containing protein, partial [Candidatus Eremiobacteraeota bacterium]|nr:carboxypeptidase regulatory-like domain-containing protein [Candidatus Eremiobacteraeota bacterium]